MEQFRQSLNADQFKIDPKQMEELKRQMEEFRKSFPQNLQFDRRQLDELQRQIEPMRDMTFDQKV
jgi:hypothetical protein